MELAPLLPVPLCSCAGNNPQVDLQLPRTQPLEQRLAPGSSRWTHRRTAAGVVWRPVVYSWDTARQADKHTDVNVRHSTLEWSHYTQWEHNSDSMKYGKGSQRKVPGFRPLTERLRWQKTEIVFSYFWKDTQKCFLVWWRCLCRWRCDWTPQGSGYGPRYNTYSVHVGLTVRSVLKDYFAKVGDFCKKKQNRSNSNHMVEVWGKTYL